MLWGCCAFTLCVMMIPYFDRDDLAPVRSTLFFLTGFSSIIPFSHICNSIPPEHLHHFHLDPWVIGSLMYVAAAVFYGS